MLHQNEQCTDNNNLENYKSAHWRTRMWVFAALAIVAVLFAVFALRSDNSHTPAIEATPQNSIAVERPHAAAARARSERKSRGDDRIAKPTESARQSADMVENVRAQELVATGYRRLQQHDFEAAQDAFEQALEIQPDNVPAQQGLKAAKTAQSVDGIAGVFRR